MSRTYTYVQSLVAYYDIAAHINVKLKDNPGMEVYAIIGSSNDVGSHGNAVVIFRY